MFGLAVEGDEVRQHDRGVHDEVHGREVPEPAESRVRVYEPALEVVVVVHVRVGERLDERAQAHLAVPRERALRVEHHVAERERLLVRLELGVRAHAAQRAPEPPVLRFALLREPPAAAPAAGALRRVHRPPRVRVVPHGRVRRGGVAVAPAAAATERVRARRLARRAGVHADGQAQRRRRAHDRALAGVDRAEDLPLRARGLLGLLLLDLELREARVPLRALTELFGPGARAAARVAARGRLLVTEERRRPGLEVVARAVELGLELVRREDLERLAAALRALVRALLIEEAIGCSAQSGEGRHARAREAARGGRASRGPRARRARRARRRSSAPRARARSTSAARSPRARWSDPRRPRARAASRRRRSAPPARASAPGSRPCRRGASPPWPSRPQSALTKKQNF